MPSTLPQRLPLDRMSTQWASQLDPILLNPMTNPILLTNISLKAWVNQVNHKLGQVQQGWILTDIQGPATIYRSQPFNSTTLYLTSSAAVTISLAVY